MASLLSVATFFSCSMSVLVLRTGPTGWGGGGGGEEERGGGGGGEGGEEEEEEEEGRGGGEEEGEGEGEIYFLMLKNRRNCCMKINDVSN